MNAKVSLKTIADELDLLSDEVSSYLNKQTGEVVHVFNEEMNQLEDEDEGEDAQASEASGAEWNDEALATARAVLADDRGVYVPLPSKFDIHEYSIMEDFCRSVKNEQISSALCRMIHGRGAFGRFKESIRLYGIEENWYAFREQALKEIVKEWCDAKGIEYVGDEPAPASPQDEGRSGKEIAYRSLVQGVRELLGGERDFLANAANLAATLFQELPDVNWAGCYLLKGQDLVLGPFQGKPACTRIGPGKGVCGAAVAKRETVVVENVKKFPGHIACDSASKSEIVVPIVRNGRLIGVLDLDSPLLARFDDEDRAGLEEVVRLLLAASDEAVLL